MSLFIIVTLSIALACNLFAGLLSYVILYTDLLTSKRIQGQRYKSGIFRKRLPLIALNLSLLMILSYTGLTWAEDLFSWNVHENRWWASCVFAAQFFVLVVIDDTYFYFFHKTLHEKHWLYKRIHTIHHHAFAPFPLEYIYVHPLEWMIGAGGIPIGLGLIYWTQGSISVWAFWAFATWRNLHEIDIHSGLISRWGHKIPLFGSTEHHDLHHRKNSKGNYSSTFTFWDQMLGTTLKPITKKTKKNKVLL